MISNKILLICLAFIALTACSAGSKKQTNHHMENEKRTLVKLETTMGRRSGQQKRIGYRHAGQR